MLHWQLFYFYICLVLIFLGVKDNPTGKGRIQPWQRGLIPLHLLAESVEIPDIRSDGKALVIKADVPSFFKETLESCNLNIKRYGKDKKRKVFATR